MAAPNTVKALIDVTTVNLHFNDNVNSFNSYCKDIRKTDMITAEEEVELFKRIEKGDMQARERITEAHQRFVLAVAKRFSRDDNIMDLVQQGNLGLLHAIDSFDYRKGNRFLSYAVWYIRREISFYIINKSLVKKTNNIKTVYKVNKIKNEFFLKNGRTPSLDEIAEILEKDYEIDIKDNSYLYDVETKYLNSSYGDADDKRDTFENSQTFNEKASIENTYNETIEQDDAKYKIQKLLSSLRSREQDVMKKLYGIGEEREYTMDEVAEQMNLSRERIRQIKFDSLKKMKKYAKTI